MDSYLKNNRFLLLMGFTDKVAYNSQKKFYKKQDAFALLITKWVFWYYTEVKS